MNYKAYSSFEGISSDHLIVTAKITLWKKHNKDKPTKKPGKDKPTKKHSKDKPTKKHSKDKPTKKRHTNSDHQTLWLGPS